MKYNNFFFQFINNNFLNKIFEKNIYNINIRKKKEKNESYYLFIIFYINYIIEKYVELEFF